MTDHDDPVIQTLAADHGRKYVLFELYARDHDYYYQAQALADADDDFEDDSDPDMIAAKYAQAVDNLLGEQSLQSLTNYYEDQRPDSDLLDDIHSMQEQHGDEADQIMEQHA